MMSFGKMQRDRHRKRKSRTLSARRGIAERVVERIRPEKMDGSNRLLNTDLLALSGGHPDAVKAYYVRKIRIFLKTGCVAVFACAVIIGANLCRDLTIPDGRIERPGYGETSKNALIRARFQVNGEKGEEEEQQIEIKGRIYTSLQVRKVLNEAEEEAKQLLLGENPSADEIRTRVCFPKTLSGGAVRAVWSTVPYGMISEEGELMPDIPEKGILVRAEAELTCQKEQRFLEIPLKVFPPLTKPGEEEKEKLRKALSEAEERTSSDQYLFLPDEVDGRQVSWFYARDGSMWVLPVLLLLLPFLAGAMQDQKIREKAQERRWQLQMDYPELMWKMTLLLGAGMSLSSAFHRIAQDYAAEQSRQKNDRSRKEAQRGGKRFVYEEMLITCSEIRDGISEGKAYERFGRRCGLPRYIRLGSTLSQNLRKGSRGLASLLEQEAVSSSQERMAQARKLGEKAGTKLLFPMVLMMCVVFIILIVPAFMSL